MSLLSKIKEARKDLQERQQEEYDRKDPSSFQSGSVFIPEKIPEGMEMWKPGLGEHYFDIIPWIASDQHPYEPKEKYCWCLVLQIYREVGIMRDQFVSPYTMYKEPDPIAEYIAAQNLSKAEFKRRTPKKRCFYFVWVHTSPEEEKKGIQIWEVAHWFIYEQLKELSIIPKEGGHVSYMDFSKERGRQIWLRIKTEGTFETEDGTKIDSIQYSAPKFLDRKADIPDSVLKQSFPLETCIHLRPTYEELYKSFYGKEMTDKLTGSPAERTADRTEPSHKEDDKVSASTETHTECPAGHVLGKDMDSFPADCNNCPAFDDCSDERDRLAKTETDEPTKEEKPNAEPEKKTTSSRSKLRGRLGRRG